MADQFFRMGGRSDDGTAKALRTDNNGNIGTQLTKSYVPSEVNLHYQSQVTGNGISLDVSGLGTAVLTITGTWSATINFECSNNGTDWYPIKGEKIEDGKQSSVAVTNGQYRFNVAGLDFLRARISDYVLGSISVKGKTSAIVAQTEKLNKTEKYFSNLPILTPMGAKRFIFQETDGLYTAWPYGCLFYEPVTKQLSIAYTAGSSHVANDKKVYFRRMDYKTSHSWGGRILIADKTSEGLGATVHACGRLANGNYLAIVRFTDVNNQIVKTHLYRSTNRGTTWADEGQWKDSTSSNLNPEEAGNLFTTKNGTLLTYYRTASGTQFVTRSTDNGVTWNNVSVTNSFGHTPLEGGFVQSKDGMIICVVRNTIGNAPYKTQETPLFTISTDDGVTWRPLAKTNIDDMNNNPCALIHHEDEDAIEIFYGSRKEQLDGYGSLYQSITPVKQAIVGNFGKPKRIQLGSSARDFGYPAAVKTPDNQIFVVFYDGLPDSTSFYMISGERI